MSGANLESARFYGILDAAYVSPEVWVEKCQALLDGGADIIQLRAKSADDATRTALLEAIYPLFEAIDFRVPLVINDHMDLALSKPRLGLHVGQDDMPAEEARERLGPDRILGLSTHSLEQAADAMGLACTLDYFAVGPVFATGTKPDYDPVGLSLLKQVCRVREMAHQIAPSARQRGLPRPFFAIGGINRNTVAAVRAHGAERVVVVSDVLLADDTGRAVSEIRGYF